MTAPRPDAASVAEELARRNHELAALDDIARLAARSPDLDAFLAEALRIVEQLTGCAGVAVFVVDDEGRALTLLHQRGLSPGLAAQVASAPVEPPAIFAVGQSTADVIDPTIYSAHFRAVFEQAGVRSMARVPLVVGSRIVGVFAIGFGGAGPEAAEAHLRFLRAVGGVIGAVINADGLLGSLRRRVSELTLLNDLAVASAQLDPVYLVDGALRRIADVFGCDMGAAFLRDEEQLVNVAIFGVRPEAAAAARIVPVGTGPAGVAVQRREVLAFASPEEAGGLFAQKMVGEGLHGVVGVPLLTKGRPVGGFVLGRRDDRPFTEEERRFLKTLGAQLGVAVENSRLYAAARRQVTHLEAVHALAMRVFVHPPGDEAALLGDGCREIASALDAPTAAAFLLAEDGRSLRCRALHGVHGALVHLTIPLDAAGLSTEALRRGLALQTPNTHEDPRIEARRTDDFAPMSALVVPLGSREIARGVVFVIDQPGRTFNDQEVALVRAMVAALGVGLENAGLAADLGKSHAELEWTQSQLLQRERLAALGALSAAVAHEVRNPLGVIFNAVGMMRRHRAIDDEARRLVDMVGEEAERLNRIVTDLLGFARPAGAAIRSAPLAPVVEEAVRAALAGSRAPIETVFELAPDLPPVAIDPGLVRQAVINVVLNAVQAMARGGRLRVRTFAGTGSATVEVIDTGPGIPDELRERIFEPFFTTKTSGTGLGLAIVKHVVEVHGGAIEVGRQPEGGTRLALRFPLAALPGASTPPPAG